MKNPFRSLRRFVYENVREIEKRQRLDYGELQAQIEKLKIAVDVPTEEAAVEEVRRLLGMIADKGAHYPLSGDETQTTRRLRRVLAHMRAKKWRINGEIPPRPGADLTGICCRLSEQLKTKMFTQPVTFKLNMCPQAEWPSVFDDRVRPPSGSRAGKLANEVERITDEIERLAPKRGEGSRKIREYGKALRTAVEEFRS